jgi:cation diffusion facilitator family transporter
MSCDCHIDTTDAAQRGVLRTLLGINATMFAVEIVVGIIADSAGVLADSLDMLADALVYGVALLAVGRASGFKAGAARWSGWFQIGLATAIVIDVGRRALFGSEPDTTPMLLVSAAALAANLTCLILLARHRHGEVHMRASWIFTRSDVIANAGVILAAILVSLTGTRWPDLLIGAALSCVVLSGGISIIRDAAKEARKA